MRTRPSLECDLLIPLVMITVSAADALSAIPKFILLLVFEIRWNQSPSHPNIVPLDSWNRFDNDLRLRIYSA